MLDHHPKNCMALSWGAAQWIAKFCNADWGDTPKNKNNLKAIYRVFHTEYKAVDRGSLFLPASADNSFHSGVS